MAVTVNKQLSLMFQAPYTVLVEEAPIPQPGPGQVLIESRYSAISRGTEMLFYRGQVHEGMAVDDTIEALAGELAYPLAYGYALVGNIAALGPGVDDDWIGRPVFVFAPHRNFIVSQLADVHPVPAGLDPEDAVLLPFMETAVSFLMDGRPMIGERVLLFGQGIVGLLTTALLAGYPLSSLLAVEPIPLRRDWSQRLGATGTLDPQAPGFEQELAVALQQAGNYQGADLVFELSGNPQVLDQAIACAGFDGRLLVGSWYGRKTAPITLGGHFHRRQLRIVSSQVSHIAPRWRGRFDKSRRLQVAWQMLAQHQPRALITQRFPLTAAAEAYQLLDQMPQTTIQVIFDYQAQERP